MFNILVPYKFWLLHHHRKLRIFERRELERRDQYYSQSGSTSTPAESWTSTQFSKFMAWADSENSIQKLTVTAPQSYLSFKLTCPRVYIIPVEVLFLPQIFLNIRQIIMQFNMQM